MVRIYPFPTLARKEAEIREIPHTFIDAGRAIGPTVPDAALGPARIWINQETPRQKETPEWRPFPAKEGAVLDLSPDGKWRCLLNPVQVLGSIEENATVERWTTSRSTVVVLDEEVSKPHQTVSASSHARREPARTLACVFEL